MPIDSLMAMYGNTYADTSADSLEKALGSDLSKATDDELMDVCKDFEAYFVEQMFKAMEKMVPDSDEDKSASTKQLEGYYKDEMLKAVAEDATETGGFGLAQTLYEQMKRNYNL